MMTFQPSAAVKNPRSALSDSSSGSRAVLSCVGDSYSIDYENVNSRLTLSVFSETDQPVAEATNGNVNHVSSVAN